MKLKIIGCSLNDIEDFVSRNGMKPYLAKQVCYWIYNHGIESFDQMINVSKNNRGAFDTFFSLEKKIPLKTAISADNTKKYLFKTEKGNFIESAYIPDGKRHTLCISSQAGCKMNCKFCYTGKQGFQENLSVFDIINQLDAIPERDIITNIVFMGMGEPFDNYDNVLKAIEILTAEWGYKIGKRKITVSTAGVVPGIDKFLKESESNLAVSLHSPFEVQRSQLMPINNKYSIKDIIDTIRNNKLDKQRRVSFEYIMFKDINDTQEHINQLAKVLNGLRCMINLISYHTNSEDKFQPSSAEHILWFRNQLSNKGFPTTIRSSRGQDIEAACGLLSTKELLKLSNDKESNCY